MTLTQTKNESGLDVVCFSHLRWGFVFQRPQHLMSRFGKHARVFFVEEPVFEDVSHPSLRTNVSAHEGVNVVVPVLPHGSSPGEIRATVTKLLDELFQRRNIRNYVAWYYTPMAIEHTLAAAPRAIVYDCMDELSMFRFAPPELHANESQLFDTCDLVFTGGISLYEAKQQRHPRVYAFPSSVDVAHFKQARDRRDPAQDQRDLPRPRLGYAGVIDERIDLNLLREVAERRPEWQIMMIGPVAKINPADLPQAPNIHWLGMKSYRQLPDYFSGWDIGIMPFAMNDSTLFISPTKTPEYLAAGLPVISTPIRDVVRVYESRSLASVVNNAAEFVSAAEQLLAAGLGGVRQKKADEYLATGSWNKTWSSMNQLIEEVVAAKQFTQVDGVAVGHDSAAAAGREIAIAAAGYSTGLE